MFRCWLESQQKSFTDEMVQEIQATLSPAEWKTKQSNSNTDLMYHNRLGRDGTRYDSHGMIKVSNWQQLRDLIGILSASSMPKLHSAPLGSDASGAGAGFGTGGTSYQDGSFVLVSEPGKQLSDGIGSVIVNDYFYSAIPILQRRFPRVKFVRADQMMKFYGGAQKQVSISQKLRQLGYSVKGDAFPLGVDDTFEITLHAGNKLGIRDRRTGKVRYTSAEEFLDKPQDILGPISRTSAGNA